MENAAKQDTVSNSELIEPLDPHGDSKMQNIEIGKKALLSLDNWFYAPDGNTYRAVFGTVKAVKTAEETLGVRTNAKSTNWYIEIGNLTVAGCQVHFAVRTDDCSSGPSHGWTTSAEHGIKEYDSPSNIYFADRV